MTTPVRHQYLQMKKQYPDAILFFRLGDFYETFDDDAQVVADICDIALTSRPVGKNQRVPLAGVPYHSADTYISRLIAAGHKVAIAEQVGGGVSSHLRSEMSRGGGDKSNNGAYKGIVHREVVRVVTPGTVVEPGLLDDRRNNYLMALVIDIQRGEIGLAYTDISTGEFAATQIGAENSSSGLIEEIARLQPTELVIGRESTDVISQIDGVSNVTVTPYDDWHFDLDHAREALQEHFEVLTLDGFGMNGKPLAIRAAGAIVQYLRETQKHTLSHLKSVVTYSTGQYMTLDAATRRNLELTQTIRTGSVQGSLLGILDLTITPMGARQIRNWIQQPLFELDSINRRLAAVETLAGNATVRVELRSRLKQVADLERLANRVLQGIIRPRELLALGSSLATIPDLRKTLSSLYVNSGNDCNKDCLLHQALEQLDPCRETAQLISQAIADDTPAVSSSPGVIRRGFSAELDQVLTTARDAKTWVANLEQTERQRAGIKNLKVGFNKVFGYYIEISKSNLKVVPEEYIRKQTLVNAERFITPELKEYEALILNAEERQLDIEMRVYREVCEQVAASARRLLATARAIAMLDTCATLAEVAVRNDYVRPEMTGQSSIDIIGGRHPVVEHMLMKEDVQRFVPNDVHLSKDELILVITGPNMSGKSTYLRQVALIVLMAQIGSFVPAEKATIGLVDRIFTRIGAEDIIHAGQSTFMVEMVETANILHHATPRSLLILDEIGRGTSTYDGLSIAWAVVEYIHNHPNLQARTLFATHFHELTELAELLPRVHNFCVAVAEEGNRVVFLHQIVPGGANRSYGIHVAQLAGLPRSVVHRAEEILLQLEQEGTHTPTISAAGRGKEHVQGSLQLPLFPTRPHPVVELLRRIDVNSLTPLEAISKLYELQQSASAEDE